MKTTTPRPGALDPTYLQPDTLVGYYRVVDKLGSGGLAAVYQVERDGKPYALKIATYSAADLPPEERDHLDSRAKLEFGSLSLLKHPGIVTVHEFGRFPTSDGYPYLVMDFVEGVPLYDWQAEHNPSLREIGELFADLGDAVGYMHQHNVVHRDMKSGNVLVVNGKPKIIDFNVARPGSAATLTMAGGLVGTPSHLTPEQCEFFARVHENPGSRFVAGPLQDLHAVGFILYEMLAGQPPWVLSDDDFTTLQTIRKTPPKPLGALVPRGVPVELCDVAMRLLRRDPAERFQTGYELKEALESIVERLPTVPYPSRFPPRPRRPSSVSTAPAAVAPGAGTKADRPGAKPKRSWAPVAGLVLAGVGAVAGVGAWLQVSGGKGAIAAPVGPGRVLGAQDPLAPKVVLGEQVVAAADPAPRPEPQPPALTPLAPVPVPAEPSPGPAAVAPIVPAPSAAVAPIPLVARKPKDVARAAGPAEPVAPQPSSNGVLVQVIRADGPAPGTAPAAGPTKQGLGAPRGMRFQAVLADEVVAMAGTRTDLTLPRPIYHGASAVFPSRTRLLGTVGGVSGDRVTVHIHAAVLPDGRTLEMDANASVPADTQAGTSCEVVLSRAL